LVEARHLLGPHLDSLRESLAVLGERLRDAVAHSVGGTVAGVAREAVRGLLASPDATPVTNVPSRASHPWGSEYGSERSRYEDDTSWPSEWPERQRDDDPRDVHVSPAMVASAPLRWSRALAVGFQTIAWWLRRQATHAPTWATLSIGALVALVAYWCGAALSSAVLSFLTLADAPQAATSSRGWSSLR